MDIQCSVRNSLAGIMLAALLLTTPYAGEYTVIVHPSVAETGISKVQLEEAYTGDLEVWTNNTKIKPCYVKEDAEGGGVLFDKCIGMTAMKFKKVWLKKVFAGYGTEPAALRSVDEVVSYVASTPGAIGVIPDGVEAAGCKKLDVK